MIRRWLQRRSFVQFAQFARATIWADQLRDPNMPIPYWPLCCGGYCWGCDSDY